MMLRVLVLMILGLLSIEMVAQDGIPAPPNPPRLVNDLTRTTLSARELTALETKLLNYEDTTSTQIAVVIVPTTEPYEIADFAQRTGQSWGVGSSRDNGIMIVIAVNDRLAHIATGYGMEGAIPDAAAYTIITDQMRPHFRNNNYYRGLDDAVDVIIALASGEYTAQELTSGDNFDWGIVILFVLIFVIFPMWSAYRRRKYQDYGSRSIPWWLFMGGTGGGRRGGNNWGDFSGGSGGFGGGGGFGGFGGGGFGGGGATGGW